MTIIVIFILFFRWFLRLYRLHRLQTLLHTVASKIGSPAIFVPDRWSCIVFGDSRYRSAIVHTLSHLGNVFLHLDILKDWSVIHKSFPWTSVPCELGCFFEHRIHCSLCTVEQTKAIVSRLLLVGRSYVLRVGISKLVLHAWECWRGPLPHQIVRWWSKYIKAITLLLS